MTWEHLRVVEGIDWGTVDRMVVVLEDSMGRFDHPMDVGCSQVVLVEVHLGRLTGERIPHCPLVVVAEMVLLAHLAVVVG